MTKIIYVVDDTEDIYYSIKDSLNLKNPDYEIIRVDSAIEFLLKMNAEKKPDLIILDIMLPDINGIDLAGKIRGMQEFENTPILFLSARIDDETKKKASQYSKYYMEKPFDVDALNKKVNKIL